VKHAYPHVAPLGGAPSAAAGNIVHMLNPDTRTLICNRSLMEYKKIRGVKVKIMYEVDSPVNCKGCRKSLEGIARERLALLTAAQLEDFMENTNGIFTE
jgi:hypothetical protein